MIEKLKKTDIEEYPYKDQNDIHYLSIANYIQNEILGWCSCGNPDEVMLYVKEMLEKLDKNDWGDYKDIPYMFFVYWADDKGFTEHGCTVRCSWLTDKGKELLKDINYCIEKENICEEKQCK